VVFHKEKYMGINNRFMGYCPFCGRPMLFREEKTKSVKACPVCTAPIAFQEVMDFERDTLGYEIVPDVKGESFERDGYTVENGMITHYTGDAAAIVTPRGAIAIAPAAFRGNKSVKSVVLSDDIRYVGNEAFLDCEGVRTLTISENVVSIGNSAFRGCRRLERVTVPASLRAAGYAVFHSCENLTELLMPMDMVYLGGSPYGFCKKLKVANIPHCVTDLGPAWFQDNDRIEILTVGRSAVSIRCPSGSLREVYFTNPEGWKPLTFFFGEGEDVPYLPEKDMKSPKTAASLFKKHASRGHEIYRPDAPEGERYWLLL